MWLLDKDSGITLNNSGTSNPEEGTIFVGKRVISAVRKTQKIA